METLGPIDLANCDTHSTNNLSLTVAGRAKGGPCVKGQATELSTMIEKSTARKKKHYYRDNLYTILYLIGMNYTL